MSRFLQLSLLAAVVIFMLACILSNPASPTASVFSGETTAVGLDVRTQPNTFTAAGQSITYNFDVKNNSTSALAGPVSVTVAENKLLATCPNLNTVGNNNNNLDPQESITCTASYTTIATDVTATNFTIVSTASVGGLTSNTVTTRVQLAENKVLVVTIAAQPPNYNAANQQIALTYTVKNIGATALSPGPFIVRDALIPNPINCGTNTTIIGPNESIQCGAVYTTTPTDAGAAQLTSSATASGAGAGTAQATTLNILNTLFGGGSAPGNYTKGSTIQHDVNEGEWMIQIARCYGANIDATLNANPQVVDPDVIFPTNRVTVPNVGSVGTAYGPPCVKLYIVKSGDTWQSIANDPAHDAAVNILMEANRNVSLTNGQQIKIPVHSKSYGSSVPSPVTPAPGNQPIRLNFPPGSPKVSLSGNIGTPQTIRHVFTGTAGQILTVKLVTPPTDVNVVIYAPNGTTIPNVTNSWTGTLTMNGDHFIDLVSSVGATTKQYSLEVTLNSPVPAGPIERVIDINPGGGDSNVSHLRPFAGQLYFRANAGDGVGGELWRYDAGLKAISRVADIKPGPEGSELAFLTQYGDFLYFRANGDSTGGSELWRFNGSTTGRVTDINSGVADANPMYLTVFKEALYFSAKGSDGKGTELWKYDYAVQLASRVTDINPEGGDSNPAYLAEFNDALYFSATSIDGGTELWKYDGTSAIRVADINPGVGNSNPAFLAKFNGALYFSANSGDTKGTELWKYDGINPPVLAYDINPSGDSVPTYLTVLGNALYFSANGDSAGFELWKFDGTNPPSRISDINPTGDSNPAHLAVHLNELYFQANANDGFGAELWKFKGP